MRSTSRRLLAVMAMVAAIVVPASGAGAQVGDHECDGFQYNPADNNHVLYGLTEGTPVNSAGKMRVDLGALGAPPSGTFVLFWDGGFTPGTNGVEVIGSPYDDVICGTSGDDDIWGRQGNDRIFGFGSDTDWSGVLGDGSGDQLFGNQGNDFVTPGDGNDQADMVPGFNRVVLGGGPGNDVIFAGAGDFSLARGGTGNDTMFASLGFGSDQHLRGGDGDDTMFANGSDRVEVLGSLGDDTLFGGSGDDQDISGNNGDDTIEGGSGDDQNLYGGGGNDTLIAHSAADRMGLFGGRGDDTISGLGADNDQLADGGPGNDTISGVGAPDATDYIWAFGGEGNDTIIGGGDVSGGLDDRLFGDYADSPAQVVGIVIRGFAPAYFIDPAASGNDYIEGRDGADAIYGGPGADTLYGNMPKTDNPNIGLDLADDDDDDLFGGDGNDTLFGNGETGCGEDDFADGGANFAAGDSSWGFEGATHTINVENISDENACPVLP